MDMSGHNMAVQNQVAPDLLPPPQKMTGIGNSYLQISANAEAQTWFDQGLNLLHGYWDYESARAFEQSIRVAPDCAICYWGLYQAESFYHSLAQGYAKQALDQAMERKGRANDRERRYIEATADDSPGKSVLLWRELVKDYPDDIQAKLFLSNRVDLKERLELLESILREDPNNSAANHYYIHALEGVDPARARHSAEVLSSLAPDAGHMVHMPGHIFSRLGDYAKAERAFAASTRVDEKYMREQNVEPDDDWNYVHNLMYAIANLMEEGKLKLATELSVKLTRAHGKLPSALYPGMSRDSISRLNPQLPVALRLGDWAQVRALLKASPVPKTFPNLTFLADQLRLFADGMLAANAHKSGKAEMVSRKFDENLAAQRSAKPSPGGPAIGARSLPVMPDAELQPLVSVLGVMSLELRASVLVVKGRVTDAHSVFVEAEDAEKNLGYREPPSYIRPVGETEGTAMLAAGDWTDARAAWEHALAERPRSGFALYGIALSDEKAGKTEVAAKEYRDFLDAWKDADARAPAGLCTPKAAT